MALDVTLFTQLNSNPALLDVLKEVLRSRFASGWSVTRELNKDPLEVEKALVRLKSLGVVDAESSNLDGVLDGVYYPTKRALIFEAELRGR